MKKLSLCLFCLSLLPTLAVAQNVDMGATYSAFEAQAVQVTTHFDDAVAVTTRHADGELVTALATAEGRELGRLWTTEQGRAVAVQLPGLLSGTEEVAGLPFAAPTTDWANLQLYSLWQDFRQLNRFPVQAERLEWLGNLLRPRAALLESAGVTAETFAAAIGQQALEVETVFPSFIATSQLDLVVPEDDRGRGNVAYATFSTTLTSRDGAALVGLARWFGEQRVFTWSLPGLTDGWVSDERLPGGLPFNPDMAWANVQALAFYQLHSQMLLENTPGCDGLHWLDDTILRPCCDRHDLCYEKNGCTARSWFVIGASWSCIKCNIQVVFCFLTGGGGGGSGGGGGGGWGGGGCTQSAGSWCPAECFSCTQAY